MSTTNISPIAPAVRALQRRPTFEREEMKKKATKRKISVELTAVWGNDDADSTIKISRRRWNEIQGGAKYATSAWSWYEGIRQAVTWRFSDGEVSIDGEDGMQCVVELPISQLLVQIAEAATRLTDND